MRSLGRIEWFGLLVLAAAAGIAIMFFNAGAGSPATDAIPTGPTATPTSDGKGPDSVPARTLPGEPSWVFTFLDLRDARPQPRDRAFGQDLDFAWDAAPFPEYPNDGWRFVAEWSFSAPPGRYGIMLEFRGDLRIEIDGVELLTLASTDGLSTARAAFTHDGGSGSLRITLTDRLGPASIAWRSLQAEAAAAEHE
jgi:hypothetical protein